MIGPAVIGIVFGLLVIAGLAVNGLRLRVRMPSALPATSGEPASGDWAWITSRGTIVDDATLRDATAYAQAEGLDLVDLVPRDLSVTAARDLLRETDPRAYRSDRLAGGRSAGLALLATEPLLARAGVSAGSGLEPADVIAVASRVRPCASHGAAMVTAPGLRSVADDLSKRRARLAANGEVVPIHLVFEAMPYVLTVIALLTAWPWGLAAAAAYCLQPYLIFAGSAVRPRGLHLAALLRPVFALYVGFRTIGGKWRSAAQHERDADLIAAADYYRDALAEGTGRFFAQRRSDCPWCGSAGLSRLVRSPDLVLGKPGTFTLERCGGCGHVFQNPRLTAAGLDFYYRDAYDGLGAAKAEGVFLSARASYRARARMLEAFTTPKAWLDVGAGHGHFCAMAREIWPETVFDGLDQGAGIEEAERRGWIATAYRGMFPDQADELTGRYDVVSMHHYLEHTTDPFAELDAAARVLPSGGYLLIEVPDPQWPLARLLGRYWMPWFQPQHQHMMPLRNLTEALAERGLRPVAIERGAAHQDNDLVTTAFLFFARLAPDRAAPWSDRPPTAATRAWQSLVWIVGGPAILAGLLVDRTLIHALARRWDRGNAYRVLARKEAPSDAR
ncbi:MAG TPA: class I SAM-dependent methyltransferase [Streptosporangiaceae bacterium]